MIVSAMHDKQVVQLVNNSDDLQAAATGPCGCSHGMNAHPDAGACTGKECKCRKFEPRVSIRCPFCGGGDDKCIYCDSGVIPVDKSWKIPSVKTSSVSIGEIIYRFGKFHLVVGAEPAAAGVNLHRLVTRELRRVGNGATEHIATESPVTMILSKDADISVVTR